MMKLLNKNHSNQLLITLILTLNVFLGVSFTSCNTETKSELKYHILNGENRQNEQLIILLHGMNSNTEMWNKFAQSVNDKTLIIAVQAPFKTETNAYRWYDIDITTKNFESDISQMIESTNKIGYLINDLKSKYKIEKNKVVIAGFSQGAILSLNFALTNPNSICGAGIFSGMLPQDIENRISNKVKDFPFFITHGSLDKGIDISHAKKTESFLKEKNTIVKMSIENSGHDITIKQFQDFITWTENLHVNK